MVLLGAQIAVNRVLFLFLDGVGLGPNDVEVNPLAAAEMPFLRELLTGSALVSGTAPYDGPWASLRSIDAGLGVPGTPQSATGQAALLTGRNVPELVGEHYGPKPNQAVRDILDQGNLFKSVIELGGRATLLNAYPPRYFENIASGHRLYSSIPYAVASAGIDLQTAQDLQEGQAFSADFTGVGWSQQPGFPPGPVYDAEQAGVQIGQVAVDFELSWFDYWASDFAGHRQDFEAAVAMMETLDAMLRGLVESWRPSDSLVVISSDHGNMEDMSVRGHTENPVPGLVIGPPALRLPFAAGLRDLTDFAPAVLHAIRTKPSAGSSML